MKSSIGAGGYLVHTIVPAVIADGSTALNVGDLTFSRGTMTYNFLGNSVGNMRERNVLSNVRSEGYPLNLPMPLLGTRSPNFPNNCRGDSHQRCSALSPRESVYPAGKNIDQQTIGRLPKEDLRHEMVEL